MKTLVDDRRLLLPVLLTAMAIAIGSVLIVLFGGDASGSSTPAASSSPTIAAGGSTMVDITDFKYRPMTVTVKAGARVSWTNHDAAPHTATAAGTGDFDTGTLKQGDTKTVTLRKPGTYAYTCAFHPFMKATVVVR